MHVCLAQSAQNLFPLIALSEELKSEVQLLLCCLSVCTAVGSRQTLQLATLETVRFLYARKLFYLPATLSSYKIWVRVSRHIKIGTDVADDEEWL